MTCSDPFVGACASFINLSFGTKSLAIAATEARTKKTGRASATATQPSDNTSALQNLNVASGHRRFDAPDKVHIVFADEDDGRTGNKPLRKELINPIGGRDGALPMLDVA